MKAPLSPSISDCRRWARRTSSLLAACVVLSVAQAQDPIQSLQFANPTLVNPAFAGLVEGTGSFNFSHRFRSATDDLRMQTSVFEASLPLNLGSWFTGGAGLTIINDNYGGLRRNAALANLAWEAPLGRRTRYIHLRAGVQAGMIQSSVLDPLFVFEDMYNATLGEFSGPTTEGIAGLSSPVRLDVSAGLMLYRTQKIKGNREINYFASGALYHVNRPNMGLLPSDDVQRSIRSMYMIGAKYRTRSSVDLNFNTIVQTQNNSTLLTYTAFARLVLFERGVIHGSEQAAFTFGTSLRQQFNDVIIGTEVTRRSGLESLMPFVGFEYGRGFGFGLAYDAIISESNALTNASGGLQFSARYVINPRKYKGQSLPFPTF